VTKLHHKAAQEFHEVACRLMETTKKIDVARMLGVDAAEYSNVLAGRKGSLDRIRRWVRQLSDHVEMRNLSLVVAGDQIAIRRVGVLRVGGQDQFWDDHVVKELSAHDGGFDFPVTEIRAVQRGWEHLSPDTIRVVGTPDEVREKLARVFQGDIVEAENPYDRERDGQSVWMG